MKSKITNRVFYALLLVVGLCTIAQAQVMITADDVYYAPVDSVFPNNDTIKVADLSSFQVGDKVMMMQMTGAEYKNEPPTLQETFYINNTGTYEIISIKSINPLDSTIVFVDPLQRVYDNGESIQIAKVVEHNKGIVNSDIEVQDWNGETGGIFPILTYTKLILDNAKLDASGKGFRGADPNDPFYERGCSAETQRYYHNDSVQKAAKKGESYIEKGFLFNRGFWFVANGGGGSNGQFGGGAGGGNFGAGGPGGKQSSNCSGSIYSMNKAQGGRIKSGELYSNTTNRITFGGGGGTSTHDNEHQATKGGDGGGIILILTDTLESNNGQLISNGEDVTGLATAGAGGGGAGGTVLLDYSVLTGSLYVSITGGDGGTTQKTDICTGNGGGGGGGILWYRGNALENGIMVDSLFGNAQNNNDCLENLAFEGEEGGTVGNLRLPLTGFLFNFISGSDTICAGQVPDTIKASMPRGGDGNYDYLWQYSFDSINWEAYPSDPEDSLLFTPNPLDTTTFFRRVVSSAGQSDTSKTIVKIFVWPAIENNDIEDDQTLCYLQTADTLSALQPNGGDNTFFYRWEKSNDLTNWTGVDSSTISTNIAPGSMSDTTYYRRFVQSVKVCTDYSDTVTIIVQPDLENYDILNDQDECYNYLPEPLTGTGKVSGGDHTNYYFSWQYKEETGPWSQINNDTTLSEYQPPPLTDTTHYRRIVRSGVCIDTSNLVTIHVQPPIENNLIFEDHKICYGDTSPVLFDNGTMNGGNHINYLKTWQLSEDRTSWSGSQNNSSDDYSPGRLFDTTYFRRIVNSGACFDTSNTIEIEVVPEIINNLSTPDTTICNGFAPLPFMEGPASGGYGGFTYEWQRKAGDQGWQSAVEPNNQIGYEATRLFQTTYYRRAVASDICLDLSDTITVTVLPSVTDNIIEEAPVSYTCYEVPKLLEATIPTGGDEGQYVYIWESSEAGDTWMNAANDHSQKNYLTMALTDSLYYRRVVLSGEHNQCKDTSENVLLRIHELPTGQITSEWDTTICDNEEITLSVALSGQAPWNIYLSEGIQGQLTNKHDEITISYDGTDVRKVHNIVIDSLIDANNCKATDVSGQANITSVEVPGPKIIVAEDVCEGVAPVEAAEPKFLAYWSSEYARFGDSTDRFTDAYALRFDTAVRISWTEVNDICSATVDDSIVFYRQPNEKGIPKDTVLYNTFNLELVTKDAPFGSVTWKVEEEDASILEQSTTFAEISFPTNSFNQKYHVIYEIVNGECMQSDTMLVKVEDILVPNAFSPNGDGINDYFYIEGIEDGRSYELVIFNSWGSVVYGPKNYDMTSIETLWDGKDQNGESLPEGTYYWILNINDNSAKKGFVILRRSAFGR